MEEIHDVENSLLAQNENCLCLCYTLICGSDKLYDIKKSLYTQYNN